MDLSPKQIVNELNKHIVGQDEAKKAVAIALRNRYRRSQLSPEMREEITPKNIIMKGPTGVGKTEIARRLAKLVKAPFIKVEATKYTEVGYVGKDVEGMVRDLVESAVRLVKDEKAAEVSVKATAAAEQRVVKILSELKKADRGETPREVFEANLLESLRKGVFDNLVVEADVRDEPKTMELVPGGAAINLGSIFGEMLPPKKKRRKIAVKELMKLFLAEESDKLIDNDAVEEEAVRRAENDGIIFIDEIDKIAAKGNTGGADVSREGVQRDILPIVEGSTVMTKYGPVKTDYMLFIAAGAFHVARVEDLIPELQGRFPVSVELTPLTKEDFINILTSTEHSLTRSTPFARRRQHRFEVHARRHRGDRRDLRRDQHDERRHRRAPPPYGDGVSARRHLLQRGRRRLSPRHGGDRPQVRRRTSCQDHQEPRSQKVRPLRKKGGDMTKEQFKELEARAKSGDPVAAYDLGVAYQRGDGIKADLKRAALWWKKSAEGVMPSPSTTLPSPISGAWASNRTKSAPRRCMRARRKRSSGPQSITSASAISTGAAWKKIPSARSFGGTARFRTGFRRRRRPSQSSPPVSWNRTSIKHKANKEQHS